MYENYKLCPDLRNGELCIKVEQYREGQFAEQHHRHVPRIRLSAERRIELLRTLVARFHGDSGLGFDQIVSALLSARGKNPAATEALRIQTSYPEPGVIRQYCGANTHAWIDDVIVPTKFRKVRSR